MRKSFILLISTVFLLGSAGTVMAAVQNKTAKSVIITKLEENAAPGHVLLTTGTAASIATVKSGVSIKGMKVTWQADAHAKNNKTFYGVIDKAVIKKEYVFVIGKAFSLAKGVDAKVIWTEEMVEIEELHFLSKPGQLMFTTKKSAAASQLKGKIKINKSVAAIEAAPEGKGKTWIATVPNLKPEVAYPVEFLRPLNGGTSMFKWNKYPMMIEGATLDASAGKITITFTEPPYEPITVEHFKFEAFMGGNNIALENLAYKDGVISFKPVAERQYPEDRLMIMLQGNPEKWLSGFFRLAE